MRAAVMMAMLSGARAFMISPAAHATTSFSRRGVCCCSTEAPASVDDFCLHDVQTMMQDVRKHYRSSGDIDEGQACQNLMVTRVKDFSKRISRCRVAPSTIHGDGLFSTRPIVRGDLITFFPGDSLLFWEGGDRTADLMVFFGAHIPQSDRDAQHVSTERVKDYELYCSAKISAVGDPNLRDDAAYLGHFANDGSTCDAPGEVSAYIKASSAAANAEAVLLEGCHFALQATRDIASGEEVLRSYGEGYWLARGGHAGVGADLRLVGSAVGAAAAPKGDALKRALAAARPKKKKPTKAAGKRKKGKAAAATVGGTKTGFG